MQLLKPKSGKKEPKQIVDDGFFESLDSIRKGAIDSLKKDVGKDSVYDAWDQFLNKTPRTHESYSSEAEMMAGEEIDFEALKGKTKEITEDARDYVREVVHAGEKRVGQESREIQVKMQEILIEIKQLKNSSEELKNKIEVIEVGQAGDKPGVYHLNFLEQVLEWLRDARMNVEDSLAWFHALRSKKAARQYGVMAKKGGTSFTLSSERVVSTQTG